MYLLESPHEILRIFVPQHLADLVHRQAGVLQEQMRLLEAYLVQELGEGAAEQLFHISGAVGNRVVEMPGQLLQGDGGIVFLEINQDLMIYIPDGSGFHGGLPVPGELGEQGHQHPRDDPVRVGIGGEHLLEHVQHLPPYARILPGAEHKVLLAVLVVDAVQKDQGLQVGYGCGITKDCEDPVRAIKFLDYLCSDEGARLYKWGIEGENYEVDENGNWYRTPEEITKSQTDPDYSKNTGIGNYTGSPIYGDGAEDENGVPYTPVTKESVAAEYNDVQKATCEAWNVNLLTDIFPQPEEFEVPPYSPRWAYAIPQELNAMQSLLDEIAWPGIVKCVQEPEANFDANWDAMIAELEANGLEEANQMMTDFLATKIN